MQVMQVDMSNPEQRRAVRDLELLAAAVEAYDAAAVQRVVDACDIAAVAVIAANEINRYRGLQSFLDTPVQQVNGCRCAFLRCAWQAAAKADESKLGGSRAEQ